MQQILDAMPDFSFFWLVIVIIFGVAEACTVNLVSIWFAVGALAAFIAAMCNAAQWGQIVLFLVVSLVMLLLLRPISRKAAVTRKTSTNADRLIGRETLVTEAVDNIRDTGAVRIGDVTWRVRSADDTQIEKGTLVKICAIHGATLTVAPAPAKTTAQKAQSDTE